MSWGRSREPKEWRAGEQILGRCLQLSKCKALARTACLYEGDINTVLFIYLFIYLFIFVIDC